jgi:predicted MFS family arabinose efflux permease
MTIDSRISVKVQKATREKILEWFVFERNELLVILSLFFYHIGLANFAPYAPLWLIRIEEVTFIQIGLVNIITNGMMVIGTLLWGFLADKFGTKNFVILGVLGMASMYVALIFSTSSTMFLTIILVGYFFGSAQQANYYALGTTSTSKPKEIVLGKMTAISSIAWVIMSPISGSVFDKLDENTAMRTQLIIAIGGMIIAFILAFLIKDSRNKEENSSDSTISIDKPPIATVPNLYVLTIVLAFFMQALMGGFWAYNTVYFIDTLGVKAVYYSIFLIATTALAVPISIFLGNISSSEKITKIAIIYSFVMALAFLLMTIFPTNAVLNLIVYSVPMYPFYGVAMYTLVANFTNKERRAAAYGIFSSIGVFGVVAGIFVLGILADNSSLGIFIMLRYSLIYAILTIIFATILLFLIKRRKKVNKENLNEAN